MNSEHVKLICGSVSRSVLCKRGMTSNRSCHSSFYAGCLRPCNRENEAGQRHKNAEILRIHKGKHKTAKYRVGENRTSGVVKAIKSKAKKKITEQKLFGDLGRGTRT